jgi:hypothetical protein
MNQALYAHMNNKTIKKKKENREVDLQCGKDNLNVLFFLFIGSADILNV